NEIVQVFISPSFLLFDTLCRCLFSWTAFEACNRALTTRIDSRGCAFSKPITEQNCFRSRLEHFLRSLWSVLLCPQLRFTLKAIKRREILFDGGAYLL